MYRKTRKWDYREGFIHHIRKKFSQQTSAMTVPQKTVLQRRRNYLADQLEEFSEPLISSVREKNYIDDDIWKSLKEEKSPSGQVLLLIEMLLVSPQPAAFEDFMQIISVKYEDLVTELRREVKYEEGVEGVSEAVAKEAATLVHKKFGTSKRWGEGDKKDIIDLLAVTMELQNSDWQEKIQATEDTVTQLRNTLQQQESKITELKEKLQLFIKKHNNQLTNHAHGMVTTKQHMAEVFDNPKKSNLTKLEEATSVFLQRTDQILYHRDMMMEERSACLTVLGVKDDRKSLDRVIKEKLAAVRKAAEEQVVEVADGEDEEEVLRRKVTSQADHIKQLNRRITNLEEELEEKTVVIEELQTQLQ